MKVCILGAGRVGSHLCKAFMPRGHDVCVWNRSEAPLHSLKQETGCNCVPRMEDLPQDADVYLICVKDDALEDVARSLHSVFGKRKGLVAHTAGSKPMSLISPLFPKVGVLYPMQTFSKGQRLDYSKIPFFVEGNVGALDVLMRLAKSVSTQVYQLSSEQRRYLHLASVFASNFSNHCYAIASDILDKIHIPFSVMLPLIEETTHKAESIPPRLGQTGPAARGDVRVVEEQTQLLNFNTDWQQLYSIMSRDIMGSPKLEERKYWGVL